MFLQSEISLTKVAEKIKTHILCTIIFFLNFAVYVTNYFRAGQATDNNMAHENCMLDT